MAHFDYTRVGGVWSGSATVTTAEMEDIDSKTERAINGDEGGTWAPTDVITIGGDGLTVSGPFIASDCEGLTLTAGTLVVENTAEINVDTGGGLVVTTGGTFIAQASSVIDFESGCDLDIACNAEILSGGSIIFRSGSQMIANSGASVTFQSGGTVTFQSGLTFNLASAVTQTGVLTKSGSGGRTVLRTATATNTNTTPDNSADVWFITINDGATYTATCDATSPAATAGELLIVRKIGTSGQLNISSEGPIAICSIGPGEAGCAMMVFDGTQWRLVAMWQSSDPANIFSGA